MQVLGSFTAFTIEWPDFVVNVFASLKTVAQMNPIQLNGFSCLFMDIDVDQQLHGYTLGLLGLVVLLLLPLPIAIVRGYYKHNKHGSRFRQALDKFWTNVMFVLFLVYPAVSIVALRAFNCDPNLGLLKDDYKVSSTSRSLPRSICLLPPNHPSVLQVLLVHVAAGRECLTLVIDQVICPPMQSYTAIYSAVFVLLYPIGIPFFIVLAMRLMKVKEIVKDKMDAAKVSAMLSLFMKRACSVECFRVARLVGHVDDDEEEFNRQTQLQFSMLLSLQAEPSSDVIVVENLRARGNDKCHSSGMHGIDIGELVCPGTPVDVQSCQRVCHLAYTRFL